MGLINIKNASLIQTLGFVRESFGEEAAAQLVGAMPKAVQRKIELERLDAWVSFDVFRELLQQIVDRHYGGDITKIAHSGHHAALLEFPRRFGALSLPAGQSLIDQLNSFTTLWRLILDRGRIDFMSIDEQIELRVYDFPAATEIYGHRLCGWVRGYLECLTEKAWRLELHHCDPEADPSLVFRITPA